MRQKLRMGMIGGGSHAFIGGVHRMAASLDGMIELVCGAFSSDPQTSKESGEAVGLPPDRVYGSFKEMINKEKELSEGERMQFVSIVTPNHVHFEPAALALRNGFDVVMDKPMTFSFQEALELEAIIRETGRLFCLTHTYTGYPMVREAKQLVQQGKLGRIRKVNVEYPQGWLSTFLEGSANKQASWRTDPKQSGKAGSMGDIGTHAFNLVEFVSGLKTTAVCAALNIVVEGRLLDDDGTVLLRLDNGATGVLWASQVASGEENNLRVRIYGEKGGLEWQQSDANSLVLRWPDQPAQILRAGSGYLSDLATKSCRTPAGHPEGYLEAFANLYKAFALHCKARNEGQPVPDWVMYPGVEDGVRGMAFIDAVVASSAAEQKWTTIG